MSVPINPPPVLGSGRRELPAYVSNGLIGLRVRDMPFAGGMALLSGYTGEHSDRQIEAAAVAPYPIAADLAINGVWLSDVPHQVSDLQQSYDFSCGELTTRFAFIAAGLTTRVEVLTFCSRDAPTLVCQEVSLRVDAACSLSLRAMIDARGADGRALRHSRITPGEEKAAVDGSLLWESAGALSTCGVALVTELIGRRPSRTVAPAIARSSADDRICFPPTGRAQNQATPDRQPDSERTAPSSRPACHAAGGQGAPGRVRCNPRR